MPDGPVLPGRIHALEHQQQRILVGRVVETLQGAQRAYLFVQELAVLLLRLTDPLHARRPVLELDLLPWWHPEILGGDLHRRPFDPVLCSVPLLIFLRPPQSANPRRRRATTKSRPQRACPLRLCPLRLSPALLGHAPGSAEHRLGLFLFPMSFPAACRRNAAEPVLGAPRGPGGWRLRKWG